ncbi:MAG: NADPH-dependent assimilatory sulfite reductase hemoprotein subunit [Rhodospirillaceae bacterium]
MTKTGAPSAVEGGKSESRSLRGTIAESLASDAARFSDRDRSLLKFHGIFEGGDRDKSRRLMVRVRVPAGRITPGQYLGLDDLAGSYGDGSLRVTSRQGLQFHGVAKGNLKLLVADINHGLLSTFGTGGDVVRNVMANPVPIKDSVHARIHDDALRLSRLFRPRSYAYHDLWLGDEKQYAGTVDRREIEPVYGQSYLPSKFKIALATPDDNTVDVLANDLGIIALFEEERLIGYNFALGGGLGFRPDRPKTFPFLAIPTCFIEPDDLLPAAEAVVRLHREHGDRNNRDRARLKYFIAEHGVAAAKRFLEECLGHPLADPVPQPVMEVPDLMGWHAQGDGHWFLGIPLPAGRIADSETIRLRTGLRAVIQKYWPTLVLTPDQDILLCDLPAHKRAAVEADLRRFGVQLAEDLIPLERWSLACPALRSCDLALAEAECVQPAILNAIAEVMAGYGLVKDRISVRISGCSNGCVRPYLGDIGLVGCALGCYRVYVGGDTRGTRLNSLLRDRVALADIAGVLEPLFALYAAEREPMESFGDFCHRVGIERLLSVV